MNSPAAAAVSGSGGESAARDPVFEASSFDQALGRRRSQRWMNWRRRALVLAALVGCLGVFSLARWLSLTPQLLGEWAGTADGSLVLVSSPGTELDAQRGQVLRRVLTPGKPPLEVDSLLLHRSPRWQVDDKGRARQIAQHQGLATALQTPADVQLEFANGAKLGAPVMQRRYAGLGLAFWPLCTLGLLLYLFGVVVMLARPQPRNGLYVTMAWCQAANLLFIALESSRGLGLPLLPGPGNFNGGFGLRAALDLCTGAACVHAFVLHPRRLARAGAVAAAAWGSAGLLLVLVLVVQPPGVWWWAQGGCIALCSTALLIAHRSHRAEPNPYALVMKRFAGMTLVTLVLASAAIAIAARMPDAAPRVVAWASGAWYLFLASLLLLTPFLARSREVLREFAMLAGISTVATSLDLLFVAVFSLGPFTSLAMAVFIALGVYAGARQWTLNHLTGNSMVTTERTFDQIYRAAREVQAKPARYPQRLAQLLRELFDPLEVLRVDRAPVQSRIVGGGSALLVPMRGQPSEGSEEPPGGLPAGTPSAGLLLRFAHRGQRLFTLEDARLADRVVDQLRRAVAYDQAVERGRNEERLRLAQDLHDDIGARLLTLMYQAQTPEMEDYIRHTLQDLKTLTRGLAVAEHRLSHAGAEWKADITQRLTAASVSLGWTFNFDRDMKLSVVQWSALTRVLRELVSNALYHGLATHIDVQLQLVGTVLTLQVADDGQGREPQAWSQGLGMGGVRKRVKILRGEVVWEENEPQGIVCLVRVPQFAPPASLSAGHI
ncbi:MAG TPA: ATP-binding protein [Rubrivivax sp.]|nr:ATP-binding protein [Rubrivivax sp.]